VAQPSVHVVGLRELRRTLRQAGDVEDLTEVRNALRSGAKIVADDARRRVPVRTGRARDSIRPLVSGNRAFVAGGKAKVPYYGWLDFGSRRPISGRPRSVGPWAGSGPGPSKGRFIYLAIDDKIDEVTDLVSRALNAVHKRQGLS
jgi:HK97 gp10 family phage protein